MMVLKTNEMLTSYLVLTSAVASLGGFFFGYDLGVTGGVNSFPDFQQKFFLAVYSHQQQAAQEPSSEAAAYCTYDNQALQLFTSSLFLAGIFSTLVGSTTSRHLGRKATILIAAVSFIIAIGLCAGAEHVAMLIFGRLLLGCGVGLANQAVPLFLSEMAPASYRGAVNNLFQLATTTGILVAQLVNYGVYRAGPWAWRISLAVAGGPALGLFIGMLFLPDTPNSLAERGRPDQALQVLQRIRATTNVHKEFADIQAAAAYSAKAGNSWRLLFSRKYRPELLVSSLVAFFSQINGINAILFYIPVIFSSLGTGQSTSLVAAVAVGVVMVVGTIASILIVDGHIFKHVGRKALLVAGGTVMCISEVAVAVILAVTLRGSGSMSREAAIPMIVMVCLFAFSFAWSWGPLGWLIPSEIQPLETRSAGQSFATAVNFLVAFIIGQSFLATLCAMRWGAFLFYAAFVAAAVVFAAFCMAETKGVPIEQMAELWKSHWLWSGLVSKGSCGDHASELGTLELSSSDAAQQGHQLVEK
ncbi:g4656 [Coccomyxa elongata]